MAIVRPRVHRSVLAGLLLAGTPAAPAFEPAQGQFLARQACAATRGIRGPADEVAIRPGEHYAMLGFNRPGGEFVQVRIPGARPETRWVAMGCGDWQPGVAASPEAPPGQTSEQSWLLLALSWQPAFCEIRPEKTECRAQTPERHDAAHFSLHGLWPQPLGREYCQIPATLRMLDEHRRWQALPPVALQPETRQRLEERMPGVASGLDRHEWVRHGSCYGDDAETYFRTALALVDQVNRSPVRDLVAARRGQRVTLAELRAAFEQGFGAGTGAALGLHCEADGDRRLVSEIRIALRQPSTTAPHLWETLDRAAPRQGNCEAGLVDRVGPD